MRRSLTSSAWLEAADKVAAAFFAIFAAGAVLAEALAGPAWVWITLAAVAVVGGLVGFVLKLLHERAKPAEGRRALWARSPLRVRDAVQAGLFYEIGVDMEAPEALGELGVEGEHVSYIERDVDSLLRPAILDAAERRGVTLVVVQGDSKTGKSRTLLEGVAATLPDAWLLVPRDPAALAAVARGDPPRAVGRGPSLVWLDDLEPWARPGDQGLNPQTFAALERWGQAVVVLATQGGKGIELAGEEGERYYEILSDLLTRARDFPRLRSDVSVDERVRLTEQFGQQAAERLVREGIGEFMVAAPRLVERLESSRGSPEGRAIVRAAIDFQRAGLLRPLPVAWLRQLYGCYLPGPAAPEAFDHGLAWATRPLYGQTALLARSSDSRDAYEPHDYLVAYAARQGKPINPNLWDRVVAEHADSEADLLTVASVAYHARQPSRAEAAWQRADELGSPLGAHNLGVLLEERKDLEGAEAAWRRAGERGSRRSAYNLGVLLHQRGDLEGAEAAYRRADELGSGRGAYYLGVLLEERGDPEGASAAYRRADERGVPRVAYPLGRLRQRARRPGGREGALPPPRRTRPPRHGV
jgi:hypothetical protein